MRTDFQKRDSKEYNLLRSIFQKITCTWVYGLYYRVVYNLKVVGRENVPKNGFCIVASNHISAIDPFLVVHAVGRNLAFMAKKELFENKVSSFFLDLLGAFAVNREKLSPSTIKTAHALKKTNWCLGIFPQGTREKDGNISNVSKGFASLAKTLKCDIIPVAITGMTKDERKVFNGHMKITIGKPIPFNDNVEEMVAVWNNKINELCEGNWYEIRKC